jgi:hypothetical protein
LNFHFDFFSVIYCRLFFFVIFYVINESKRNRKEEEAALHDRVKNLNLKFTDTQIEKKEVVSATCGNIQITDLDIMVGEKELRRKNMEAVQNYVTI